MKKILLFLLLFSCSVSIFASPPVQPAYPEIVIAYIVFPAGRSPDAEGRFEVEIFCKALYDIEKLEITIGHSEVIEFDDEVPTFFGSIKAGEKKIWRLKGNIKMREPSEEKELSGSIVLYVSYIFPYQELLESIDKWSDGYSSIAMLKRLLEKEKGKIRSIIKSLPVLVKS